MNAPARSPIRFAQPPALVEAGLWGASITAIPCLIEWSTGKTWPAVVCSLVLTLLAAYRWVATVTGLHAAMTAAEDERSAMQQTLGQSQKMEAVGRLTAGVAHDFNNHLTVIGSNVELVARHLTDAQAGLTRHTDAALEGVRRAAILTNRLLSFPREPSPEPEALDAERVVSGLADLLRRTLGDRVGLQLRLPGSSWFVWADRDQMENALLSLAVNARDQLASGSTLTIAVSNVTLNGRFAAGHPAVTPGDYVRITVGGAEDPEEGKPGEPTDDLTSADLFLVRTFVRDAGGCLLRSESRLGGLLWLFLPRYAPPAVTARAGQRRDDGRSRVLVVEDDAQLRGLCAGILRGAGYEVLEAPDAMEAFRLIADHGGIDLLFTDLGLPGGVSGRALAGAARNVDAGMRVLFTTGYDRGDLPEGAALLRKPFNPAELVASVRAVLAAERPAEQSATARTARTA